MGSEMIAALALSLLSVLPQAPAEDLIPAGRENWERPWIPDFRDPTARIEISPEKRLDVLILGDGYLPEERPDFEEDVRRWYEDFLKLVPWGRFRGAFRVRGLWVPSAGRATPDRRSHYRLPATALGVGEVDAPETRKALFEAIVKSGCNPALDGRRLSHTTVVMLVRNEFGRNPSGMSRAVASPDGSRLVGTAFAAYTHHEFGHAFGGLRDEYIRTAGSRADARPPERLTLHSLSNLSYTRELGRLPWAHLAPGTPLNPDARSVIGVLWIGGIAEEGVWHSEARCLMNGSHENWDLSRTRRGVSLRDRTRFCFWCEEILVARTCHRTGLLGDSPDGAALWKRWVEEFRPLYHRSFEVPERLRRQNEENARLRLPEARIYERPK